MALTVFIPAALRPFAGGRGEVRIERSPCTVGEALDCVWSECPGIRDRVLTEQGRVREHINIFVGNEDIRYTGGLQTPVPDGGQITILPSISGGSNPAPARSPEPAMHFHRKCARRRMLNGN